MKFLDIIRDKFTKSISSSGYSVRQTPNLDSLFFNNTSYFDLSEISLWTNRGIQKRSQKVGQIQFILKKNGEVVDDHPILNLLDRPNDYQTGDMFWALASEYKDISGFAVIKMITKDPESIFKPDLETVTSLELMNSSKVQILYEGNKISSFVETMPNGDIVETPFNQCIYWIKPNPKCPTEGISLLKAGIFSIDTDNQLTKYQNAIVKNGGTTDMIMSFKNPPNTSSIDKMREEYIKERRNPKNADIPYFIGGEATIERLGMTPADLAYLETKKIFARDMSVITGVPASILAYSGESTFSNAEQDYKNFLRETIKPICDDIVNLLNWKLVPMEYELSYYDPSPEDIDNKIKIVNALYTTDSSTINERREILGLEPIEMEEANEVMVSFSKSPLGEEDDTVAEELETETETTTEEKKVKGINKHVHFLLRDKSFRDMYRKVASKKQKKNEAIFNAMITDYFADQEQRILNSLPTGSKGITKAIADDLLSASTEAKIASGLALPLIKRFLEESGVEAMELLDSGEEFNMTSNIKRWLTRRANLFGKEITATTMEKLKNEFAESLEAGESRPQLINRIEAVYDGFDEGRATTIARTETHGSMQKGNMEGSVQAGSTIKIWVSVLDDATRDSHAMIDGEETEIDKAFSNGLMFAGDPSGEPEETINCRCSTV